MPKILFEMPDHSVVEVEALQDETVLDIANRVHVRINQVCLRGTCGECECDTSRLDSLEQIVPLRLCMIVPNSDLRVWTEGVWNRRMREVFPNRVPDIQE
jgi:ferredoxin